MQNKSALTTLGLMLAVVTVTLAIAFHLVATPWLNYRHGLVKLEQTVAAKAEMMSDLVSEASITGGRSRGGTFSQPEMPRSSSPVPYSRGYEEDYRPRRSSPPVYLPAPVPMPGPPVFIPGPSYTSPVTARPGGGLDFGFFFVLLVLGVIVLPIVINYLKLGARGSTGSVGSSSSSSRINELENSIVTVTRLQVALLAQARQLQDDLDKLALSADLSTKAGLSQMLQETVLTLLRYPEYWTYARSSSETLPTFAAGSQRFEQLSVEERSKFTVETLVNVAGQVRQQEAPQRDSQDVASYIVVTLLVGTADDAPLFGPISSVADLKTALQRLGAITPAYLFVYELLWTPQAKTDTLSADDLTANYPELIRL